MAVLYYQSIETWNTPVLYHLYKSYNALICLSAEYPVEQSYFNFTTNFRLLCSAQSPPPCFYLMQHH